MMSAAGGGGLNVEEVFSNYLWIGNGSNPRTIVNDIDLSGEGGLVIINRRDASGNWGWFDTERGPDSHIKSNGDNAENTTANVDLQDFNSNGFTLGTNYNMEVNTNNGEFVSWTFRKAPKFFDVVTYTGTGVARSISHSLGSAPGTIIVKGLGSSRSWAVYHRKAATGGADSEDKYLFLNTTDAIVDNAFYWNDTAPTATDFTVGINSNVNGTGSNYVAYLFAHNDGDGNFGPKGNQDIIKCDSYTGNGNNDGPVVDLGFEPQFILIKNASTTGKDWIMIDAMRGANHDSDDIIYPNLSSSSAMAGWINFTNTGFSITSSNSNVNTNGDNYIYIAVRRGLMGTPTTATDVFAMANLDGTRPTYNSGFPVDMAFHRHIGSGDAFHLVDRLRTFNHYAPTFFLNENYLMTHSGNGETTTSSYLYGGFDYQDGWADEGTNTSFQSWMWRRANSYFDIVAYTGNGVAGRTITHNLGVVPEMIWVKRRNSTGDWRVAIPSLSSGNGLLALNQNTAATSLDNNNFGDSSNVYVQPTDTTFGVGTNVATNANASTYVAYLFATAPGVSKIGTYTGSGNTQTINCGFSAGARFVLIKNVDTTGQDWNIFDTKRGIVAGNDELMQLNTVNPSSTSSGDLIDSDNSGFAVNGTSPQVNRIGDTYLFYAIA